jgi:predicted membrane metal-binding protein
MCAAISGVLASVAGGAAAYSVQKGDTGMWGVIAGISFLVGMLFTSLVMSVVRSAVATTYVVWAECPQELQVRTSVYLCV